MQLVTPKRRSARIPASVAAAQSAGKMLSASGFAYAPNAALAGRLAAAADADGKLVLGDALDADLLACLEEARLYLSSSVQLIACLVSRSSGFNQL